METRDSPLPALTAGAGHTKIIGYANQCRAESASRFLLKPSRSTARLEFSSRFGSDMGARLYPLRSWPLKWRTRFSRPPKLNTVMLGIASLVLIVLVSL